MKRIYAVIAVLAGALLLASSAGASASSSASTTHSVRGGIIVHFDNQAAGYAAVPKTGYAKAFRFITASWTVPAEACADPLADGVDQMLSLGTQVDGILGICSGSGVVFDAGFVDASGNDQFSFAARPGDFITASIFYNATAKQYVLKVTDENSGFAMNATQPAPVPPVGGADVFMSDNFGINSGALGGFGQVNFTGVKFIDTAGVAGGLVNVNWNIVESVENVDQGGQRPGHIYSAKSPAQSAFSVNANESIF